jgi:hypothetical protein
MTPLVTSASLCLERDMTGRPLLRFFAHCIHLKKLRFGFLNRPLSADDFSGLAALAPPIPFSHLEVFAAHVEPAVMPALLQFLQVAPRLSRLQLLVIGHEPGGILPALAVLAPTLRELFV